MQGGEIGVLHCCGERLFWEPQEGTSVMEVRCPKCGTTYAMDKGEDLDKGSQA